MSLFIVSGLIALSGCGGSSNSGTTVSGRSAASLGTTSGHLVDANGFTLYSSPSACTGSCLTVWPPLDASQNPSATGSVSAGSIAILSGQVTYKGSLLYYFDDDTAAGQTNGSGVGGFSLVSP
jgi:predicted lipoprotein with Yx(FWY)xxD motif